MYRNPKSDFQNTQSKIFLMKKKTLEIKIDFLVAQFDNDKIKTFIYTMKIWKWRKNAKETIIVNNKKTFLHETHYKQRCL